MNSSYEDISSSYIDSPTAWCAAETDVNPFLHVRFNAPVIVSGVVLQGDSNDDNWVKEFKLEYGLNMDNMITVDKVIY